VEVAPELCYRRLQIRFKRGVGSEENQGKHLSPLLVCVAHDDFLQCPVEASHKSVDCRVMSGCAQNLNPTKFGHGIGEL
jgi:hypothetical protein